MKTIKYFIFILSVALCTLRAGAQSSLTQFELRMENGQLTAANTYTFDVYIYNTGVDTFELRAGTISLWVNASWRNGGTITPTISSYGLATGQQSGTSAYTNGSTDYFRRTIPNVSAGSGTNIINGSRTKLFTVTLTNTASFSTSATPNFAWKFSGANSAGFTYTDTTTTASAIAVNATTVTSTQNKCYTPAYWNGTQWNSGSTSGGAVSTTSPTSVKDAVIYNGTFSGALICRNYYLSSACTHTLGSSTLEVTYNLYNGGTLSAASGTLNLTGTQITQTSNQTISGSSITVHNLGFGTSGNGGLKSLSCSLNVDGLISQSGTAQLSTGGYLKLLSTASSTGIIGAMSTGAVTGNITVERYLPASFRRYRFLSSPVVGGSTLQWRDNGATNSGRGIQITHPTGTADASVSNSPSAFWYNESSATGGADINQKWEAIDGSTTLTNGRGYRVYVRGDRTRTLMNNSDTVPNNTTIWVNGTYPVSPVNLNVTYNASLGNGWNLVGNPFPSPIDWNAAGWTKTNINNSIYIWNPLTNSFGSFDGVTAVNSCTQYIASGQAFFVQANGSSPVLTVSENAKTQSSPSDLFKGPELNTLRFWLLADTTETDEAVVRFMDGKNDGFVASEDVVKYPGPYLNLATLMNTDKAITVNYLSKAALANTVLPLQVKTYKPGTYNLLFKQVADFDPGIYLYLKDNLSNTTINLRNQNKYTFSLDTSAGSMANGRFQLIFTNKATGAEELAAAQTLVNVYPVPAHDVLTLEWVRPGMANGHLSIYQMNGSKVLETEFTGDKMLLDVSNWNAGIYIAEFTDVLSNQSTRIKFIR